MDLYRCLTFNLRGLGRMKISADSGPSGNHILLCPIWFFRMPASPKLKEMRLTLHPCMPFNSYTSYVHCNILNKSDNLMLLFVCDYCLQLYNYEKTDVSPF